MIDLIDTHCHLDTKVFDEDREAVIERAKAAQVNRIICIGAGYGIEASESSLALSKKYPNVFCSIGVHPSDAGRVSFTEENKAAIATRAADSRCVVVGETGIDFFRETNPTEEAQKTWFTHQISLALELKKPLSIHSRNTAGTRNAGNMCYELLKKMGADAVGGVFHCYAEDGEFAKKLADLNFLVSFPGTVTFKKAPNVHAAVRSIPLSQIMLETDAPFMAPEPYRGNRCESAYVREIAVKMAELKECSLEEVAKVSTQNAEKLFKLPA